MTVSQTELDHCRELALPPGSLFEFTSRFLSSEQRVPLLALYALKQAVGNIPHAPVEDSVKWAKLKWWSEEFAADPGSPSRHPVLRVLWSSGARVQLDDALLQRLVGGAVLQIDVTPNSDEDAMFDRFATLGSTDIRLELALDETEADAQYLNFLGAASILSRVLNSFAADHHSETEQLPLSLIAKHGVNLVEQEKTQNTEDMAELIRELAEKGLSWFSDGKAGLGSTLKPGTGKHLQLRLAMEERRLAGISRNVNIVFSPDQHYGPGDAWFAWRFLRRLK